MFPDLICQTDERTLLGNIHIVFSFSLILMFMSTSSPFLPPPIHTHTHTHTHRPYRLHQFLAYILKENCKPSTQMPTNILTYTTYNPPQIFSNCPLTVLFDGLIEVFTYLNPSSNTEGKKVITDYVVLYTLGVSWRVDSYVADQKFPALRVPKDDHRFHKHPLLDCIWESSVLFTSSVTPALAWFSTLRLCLSMFPYRWWITVFFSLSN